MRVTADGLKYVAMLSCRYFFHRLQRARRTGSEYCKDNGDTKISVIQCKDI